jgi:hypothetical protein
MLAADSTVDQLAADSTVDQEVEAIVMKFGVVTAVLVGVCAAGGDALAQGGRPASPSGSAAIEVRGRFVNGPEGQVYRDGKWIEMTFGRPIKRGRDLFGSGASYGKMLNSDAPVWRAGANATTRLKTEVPLVIGGKRVAPGEYSVFVDLKPNSWTFIVSSWAAQLRYDEKNTSALWGSYGYTPDKDVVRVPMKLEPAPYTTEQLTWEFVDVSDAGGTLALRWDKMTALVPFTIGG